MQLFSNIFELIIIIMHKIKVIDKDYISPKK